MAPSDFFSVFLSSWGWMKWLLQIFPLHQRTFVARDIFYNQYGSASAETLRVEREVMFVFASMQMNWRHSCLHSGDTHVSAWQLVLHPASASGPFAGLSDLVGFAFTENSAIL